MERVYLMINLFKKIKFSNFFYVILFLALISGLFKDIITFFLVIFIHELGHILMSNIFKWNIEKIEFNVYGGFITYDDVIDKPFIEEFLISIGGFIMQGLLYILCCILFKYNVINTNELSLINMYNKSIFIFNLIPIYPLDGSKILNIILNLFLPYKLSLKILNIISFILLITLFIMFFDIKFNLFIIVIFLFRRLRKFYNDIPFLFNRFLFERYKYPIKTNRFKNIIGDNLKLMKRQTKHIFIIKNKHYTERFLLSKRFD